MSYACLISRNSMQQVVAAGGTFDMHNNQRAMYMRYKTLG